MKILNLTMKNFFQTPGEDLSIEVAAGTPTHIGKSSATQRHVWEIVRLLEGGLRCGHNKLN